MATTAPATPVEAPTEVFTVPLPADLATILRARADADGQSLPDFIVAALADYCDIRGYYPPLDVETIARFHTACREALDDGPSEPVENVFERLRDKYGLPKASATA